MGNTSVALTGKPIIVAASSRQHGFSLLELLVALMVVVLVTTLVNLSVSSGGQDIKLESMVRELADVASYALDEAQMSGVDYGLLVEEEQSAGETVYSLRWLERQLDGWDAPASGVEIFATRQLPPGIELSLQLEDSPSMELSQDDDYLVNDDEDPIQPQVIFYSSGETTVGALNLRDQVSGDLLWRIEWDLLGRFDLLRRGQLEEEDQ